MHYIYGYASSNNNAIVYRHRIDLSDIAYKDTSFFYSIDITSSY